MSGGLDPRRGKRTADPVVPSAGEWTHVGREVDVLDLGLTSQGDQLSFRVAAPHDEATSAVAERAIEIPQAVEQELGARTGRVAATQQPLVEAEDGNEMLGPVRRRVKRRMIVEAQVAAQPQERVHAVRIFRARRGAPARSADDES